jgi:hypothetical protein
VSASNLVASCHVVLHRTAEQWMKVCAESGADHVPPEFGGLKGSSHSSSKLSGGIVALIVILVLVVVGVAVGGFVAYRRTHDHMRTMLEDYRRLDGMTEDIDPSAIRSPQLVSSSGL